jgi:hypothetical protein
MFLPPKPCLRYRAELVACSCVGYGIDNELYEQRDAQLNTVFREGEEGDDPQHDEATRHWRFVIKIIGGAAN